MGASAAFWAASQCSQLYVQSTAMGGSIGTYGVVYDQSAAAAQEGVKVHVVRAGAMKGVGTPGTEVTTEQLLDMQREIDSLNEVFLAGIAAGREMPIDQVRALATGQVWIGQQCVDVGLADGVANIDQARAVARAASQKVLAATKRKEGGKMAAATYQELVASCVGATPEFICEQLKLGATVEQSQKDWMTWQGTQLEAARKEAVDTKKKAAEDLAAEKAKQKMPGNDPLPIGGKGAGTDSDASDAREAFEDAVEANIAKGMSRAKAVSHVVKHRPELHEALVPGIGAQMKAKAAAVGMRH